MRRGAVLVLAVSVAVLIAAIPSPAQAAAGGTWRCSAQGNIPIGVLKVTSSGYTFQAVRNTAWAPKPRDPSNGSGSMTVRGAKVAVKDGPLRKRMGITSGFYGTTSSPDGGSYEYLDLYNDPDAAYLLRCYRP